MAKTGGEGPAYSRESYESSLRSEADSKAKLDSFETRARGVGPATFDTDTIPDVYQDTDLGYAPNDELRNKMYAEVRSFAEQKKKQGRLQDLAMQEAYREDESKSKADPEKTMAHLADKKQRAEATLQGAGIDPENPMGPLTPEQRGVLDVYQTSSRKLKPLVDGRALEAEKENATIDKETAERVAEQNREMLEAHLDNEERDKANTPEKITYLSGRRDRAEATLRAAGIDPQNPMGPLTPTQQGVLDVYQTSSRKLAPLVEAKMADATTENDLRNTNAATAAASAATELAERVARDNAAANDENAAWDKAIENDPWQFQREVDQVAVRLRAVGLDPDALPDAAARAAMPIANNVRDDIIRYNSMRGRLDRMAVRAQTEAIKEQPERERTAENYRETADIASIESDLENARAQLIDAKRSRRHWFFHKNMALQNNLPRIERRYNKLLKEYTRRKAIFESVESKGLAERASLTMDERRRIVERSLDLRNEEQIFRVNQEIEREIGNNRLGGRIVRYLKQNPTMRMALSAIAIAGATTFVPAGAGLLLVGGGMLATGVGAGGMTEAILDVFRTMRDPALRLSHRGDERVVEGMRRPADIQRALAKQEEYLIRRGQRIEGSVFEEVIKAERRLGKTRAMQQYERAVRRGTHPEQARNVTVNRMITQDTRFHNEAMVDEAESADRRIRRGAIAGILAGTSFGLVHGLQYMNLANHGVELGQVSLDPSVVHNWYNVEPLTGQSNWNIAQHTVSQFAERFGITMTPDQVNLATQSLVHEMSTTGAEHTLFNGDNIRFGGDLVLRVIRLSVGAN